METKVLLRLIKDDIKLLEEINGSFISDEELSPEEVEVALTRARSLVMEFEMLSKSVVQHHEAIAKPEATVKPVTHDNHFNLGKESAMPDKESDLIDLEEEEVSKPKVEETVMGTKAEDLPEVVKTIKKEKSEKAVKSEKLVKVKVQEELFAEVEQRNGKIPGEMPVEKLEMEHDILATDRRNRKFEGIPLESIRDGIGINDRYLFTKELFGNEDEKYEEAIAALDGLATIEEAVGYLKLNFKWNKTEAGQKFLALVKRRFTK
jgi:hypothetical protein